MCPQIVVDTQTSTYVPWLSLYLYYVSGQMYISNIVHCLVLKA